MENNMQYEQYTKELRDSTMFHMSLGSKELFHSNFLHWISTINWDSFLKILHELAGVEKFWWEKDYHPQKQNIEVRREFHHFDLSVYILDSAGIDSSEDCPTTSKGIEEYSYKEGQRVVQKWIPVLILENKMKSLPYRGQLEEYTNKAFNEWRSGSQIKKAMSDLKDKKATYSDWRAEHGITFILLSLMDTKIGQGTDDYKVSLTLNYRKNEKPLGFHFNWTHVSYRNLLDILTKETGQSPSSEKDLNQLVIQDYTDDFLSSLCNLAEKCWKINPEASFRLQISPWIKKSDNGIQETEEYEKKVKEIEEYKKLRIHDIHEKLLYDQLLVLLEKKLGDRRLPFARFDSKRNNDRFKNEDIRVFTKSDYAHGVGIFEAQFFLFKSKKLKEGYLKLIIQVQGERYCHMVICNAVSKGAKRVNDNMIAALGNKIKKVWMRNQLSAIDSSLSNFISIKKSDKKSDPVFPFEIKEPKWGKYGDNNLYQYIDIPQDKTIDEVINAMVDDIVSINKWDIR